MNHNQTAAKPGEVNGGIGAVIAGDPLNLSEAEVEFGEVDAVGANLLEIRDGVCAKGTRKSEDSAPTLAIEDVVAAVARWRSRECINPRS